MSNIPRRPLGAPPPLPPRPSESLDDIHQVLNQDRLEKERVQLLLEKQELEEENARLRKEARVEVYPPVVSVPPPPATPTVTISSAPIDIARLEKQLAKSKIGKAAMTIGVLVAIGWNAFNTARSMVPIQKSEATQARLTQTEKVTEESLRAQIEKDARTLQALRALHCYAGQARAGFQRQGLDLTSLPSGGITIVRLGDDDANRPGAPKFMAKEICPEFPKLPSE